jgi:hypothetical protein
VIYTFERKTAPELSKILGKRPGKTVDAEYLRKSPWNGKYMFWSEEEGKYLTPVQDGMQFELVEGQPPRLVA